MKSVLFDIKEVAEYLHLSVSMVRKMVRFKSIPFCRMGVKLLFPKSEIDKWLNNNIDGIKEE